MSDLDDLRRMAILEAAYLDPDYDFSPSVRNDEEMYNRADEEYQERILRREERNG